MCSAPARLRSTRHASRAGWRIGPPNDSRDAFSRLEVAGRLPRELSMQLQSMVGFRNIAVHRYHELDLGVLRTILDQRLVDLVAFADLVAGE